MSANHHRKKWPVSLNATETSEGLIPHLAIAGDFGILHAPVCVVPGLRGGKSYLIPLRRDGKLVYAMPGGRTVTA